MQSSHIPFEEAIKRKWFWNNYCRNQGACVIAIIQVGQKGGPRSKMGSKGSHSGLANRTLCRCLRLRLAMYLDRYVCLNSLDRDSQDSSRV
jgi:hypothetical protein